MKDKDFDDIGKRLYDLEADPPKNGWNKIAPTINASSGKVVWLRRHWWKPLIILMPLSFYLLYSIQHGDTLRNHPSTEISQQKPFESTSDPSVTEFPLAKEQNQNVKDEGSFDDNQTSSKTLTFQDNKSASVKEEDTKYRDSKSSTQQTNSYVNSHIETATILDSKNESTEYNPTDRQPSGAVANTALAGKISKDPSDENGAELAGPTTQVNEDGVTQQTQENVTSRLEPSNNELPPSSDEAGQSYNKEISLPSTNRTTAIAVSPNIDTTIVQKAPITAVPQKNIDADSVRINANAESETSEKITGKWRITLTFAPQYVSKMVRPDGSDEVLMTGIDRSRNKHKMGLSFAAGAGLSLTENLYLDAQISYAEAEQNIYFSYATGNVDTLIAVQQPDQSVLITPVYETSHREISSKYGFAGIRLGATHYFWSTARRRFSLTAMAGAHYLVSADVKEKRNGNWVPLKNDDLNKYNYTMMVSAGYNINLARGWELMISPAFTYYLRKVKNRELPFDIDHQSLGVNFMLSKALGTK